MRRPIGAVFFETVSAWAEASRRIPRKNPGLTVSIQSAVDIAGSFYVFCGMEGNGARGLCAVIVGCSLKSVE